MRSLSTVLVLLALAAPAFAQADEKAAAEAAPGEASVVEAPPADANVAEAALVEAPVVVAPPAAAALAGAPVTEAAVVEPPLVEELPVKVAKRFGLVAQVGLPDGVTASMVYRPLSWVRTHLGLGYNLIGVGIQGGATLLPFGWGPSFTLEAGHFFDGNANGLARQFAGASFEDSAVLRRVGYDYVSAHLGFELGRETFTFFIHGGMSYVATHINDVDVALKKATANDMSGTELRISQPPSVQAFVPSLKLGFVVYLWQ